MNTVAIITYVLAIVTAISAVSIVFVREVFHAAMLLIICLLCVAGIFVVFNSEFLAIVQLMVYAGGILVLILFGIMITVRDKKQLKERKILSVLIGVALFSILVVSLKEIPAPTLNTDLSPEAIGKLLVMEFALPFELAGVLLLISLIGAIVAATNKDQS